MRKNYDTNFRSNNMVVVDHIYAPKQENLLKVPTDDFFEF
jgi:hypothetical protein